MKDHSIAEEEELIRALATDRKRLPKMLRNEAKTRSAMYKESLRISMVRYYLSISKQNTIECYENINCTSLYFDLS